MSVGKYLYAGELSEKTHFMSRKTHSTTKAKCATNKSMRIRLKWIKTSPSTKTN